MASQSARSSYERCTHGAVRYATNQAPLRVLSSPKQPTPEVVVQPPVLSVSIALPPVPSVVSLSVDTYENLFAQGSRGSVAETPWLGANRAYSVCRLTSHTLSMSIGTTTAHWARTQAPAAIHHLSMDLGWCRLHVSAIYYLRYLSPMSTQYANRQPGLMIGYIRCRCLVKPKSLSLSTRPWSIVGT